MNELKGGRRMNRRPLSVTFPYFGLVSLWYERYIFLIRLARSHGPKSQRVM
jgi:hypothetical protein